jgi:hypothetical protein
MKKPPKRRMRVRTTDLRGDDTFARIYNTFIDLLKDSGSGVTKEEVLTVAKAAAWRGSVSWKKLVDWATEQPNVVILPLTWRNFRPDHDKEAHSANPSKYLAPNYSQAAGFADLVPFVECSERNRQIALTRYSQHQLAAARALERAERYSAVIEAHPRPALPAPT